MAKQRHWRDLHAELKIREPYSYWISIYWTEFRQLYGLRYARASVEEADAFDGWLRKKVSR